MNENKRIFEFQMDCGGESRRYERQQLALVSSFIICNFARILESLFSSPKLVFS